MDKSFHYLIMINQAIFQKKVISSVEELGLTPGQPKILDYLQNHDGCMQKEIAYACQIDPATATGILTRMEEKGLVERRMQNGNRRSSFVYITEKGKLKQKRVNEVFVDLEKSVFEGISEKEQDQFIDTFYKICRNLTDTEGLQ